MIGIIPRTLRRIDSRNNPLKRDLILLGLLKLNFGIILDPHVAYSRDAGSEDNPNSIYKGGSAIILDPFGETDQSLTRKIKSVAEISPKHKEIPRETLARWFAFTELDGTKAEFQQLITYSDIRNGNGAKYLPPGIQIKRVYARRYEGDPEGLKEVHLVGDVSSDVVRCYTRFHHLFHPPYAPDGRALENIAYAGSVRIPPSLIERVEKAHQQTGKTIKPYIPHQ